jgi:hypothetical protein
MLLNMGRRKPRCSGFRQAMRLELLLLGHNSKILRGAGAVTQAADHVSCQWLLTLINWCKYK